MNVSAKTEYACTAVLELASAFGSGELLQVRKIAESHAIPSKFLVQILLQLKAAGVVNSARGACGGYRLARDPSEITIWDVVTIVEGVPGPRTPVTGGVAARILSDVWQRAGDRSRAELQAVTFAELLERADSESMYYI
jgi:Rrf2 family protein